MGAVPGWAVVEDAFATAIEAVESRSSRTPPNRPSNDVPRPGAESLWLVRVPAPLVALAERVGGATFAAEELDIWERSRWTRKPTGLAFGHLRGVGTLMLVTEDSDGSTAPREVVIVQVSGLGVRSKPCRIAESAMEFVTRLGNGALVGLAQRVRSGDSFGSPSS